MSIRQNFQRESDPKVQTNQQEPPAVVGNAQVPTSALFSIQIEENIFKRLSDLASINGIPLKLLASRLLMHMVVYHRTEVKELVERIKCPVAW